MKQLVPRRFERKRFLAEATIRPLAGGPAFKVDVFDLGQGGLAFFTSRGLAIGQPVEITFPVKQSADQSDLAQREGRVAFSNATPDGNMTGVSFNRPLQAAEIKRLQASWART